MRQLHAKLSAAMLTIVLLLGGAFYAIDRVSSKLYHEVLSQLLNSSLAMYVVNAKPLINSGQVDDAAFIVAAYQTILAVAPDVREKSACLEMLSKTKELLRNRKHPQPELRARQNLVHALVNHNNFVTIR